MNIGIYTYGTRGDVQPYIALALGLADRGHCVTLSAPEDFKDFVEGFGVAFHPLYGKVEEAMNSSEGQKVLQTENTITLMKYFFKALHSIRVPLRKSYLDSITNVDYIIANLATIPIVSAIAEKQNKRVALTYFMPPMVTTKEFPVADFGFLNFPWYNKLTYKIVHLLYWKFVKEEINELRRELGLSSLTQNIANYISAQKLLDLYCFSPSLIAQPKDWENNCKITGFLTIPAKNREGHTMDDIPEDLDRWLTQGNKPLYMGFGSNGIGNSEKFVNILSDVLEKTNERILFVPGGLYLMTCPNIKICSLQNMSTTKLFCQSARQVSFTEAQALWQQCLGTICP